jgi:NADH dehydrogenase/NADH:ubiquinone oxidoreductase subunit G
MKIWVNGETQVEMAEVSGTDTLYITVDGKTIWSRPGQTILQAVSGLKGIGNIPALCYHPEVSAYGSCRLCTVEVEEGERTKFVAACLYPVRDGLVVRTDTKRIRELRKGILELLLARCPNVKKIQDLAREYGVDKPRHVLAEEECILCGLCVRACKEIIGRSAISLVNRGIHKEVAAPFYAYELTSECIGCGDCVYVCPTNAIQLGRDGKPVLPEVVIPYPEVEAMMRGETAKA